jgi:hypothetical protein
MSGLPAQVANQLGLDRNRSSRAGPRVVFQEAVVAHHLQVRERLVTNYHAERIA